MCVMDRTAGKQDRCRCWCESGDGSGCGNSELPQLVGVCLLQEVQKTAVLLPGAALICTGCAAHGWRCCLKAQVGLPHLLSGCRCYAATQQHNTINRQLSCTVDLANNNT